MRGALRFLSLAGVLAMAACGSRTEPYKIAPLPESQGYLSAVPAGHTRYDNDSLADLFVKLTHFYESGKRAPGLYRFEQPITVGIVGDGAEQYRPFLRKVLGQIREEAGIDIQVAEEPVNILIRMIPGEQFLPYVKAQCIVITGQPTWETFFRQPKDYLLPTEEAPLIMTRGSALIPDTLEPYKVRQCILEELLQSLGTSNDLFGLSSSMFNDDGGHFWPTKLDYLMLRVLYDPELTPGRDPLETRKQARRILARLNPKGENAPGLPPMRLEAFSDWGTRLKKLIGEGEPGDKRLRLAKDLARDARIRAEGSPFDCLGKTVVARVMASAKKQAAREAYNQAIATCAAAHGDDDIRIARLRLARAYVDYGHERLELAREAVEQVEPVLIAYGHDGEVAAAKILRAGINAKQSDVEDLLADLPDITAWLAYAMGDDNQMTEQLRR